MKYKLLAATIAAALSLSGCSKPEQSASSAPAKESQTTAEAGKPELGSFGVDLTAMDTSVKPGDDFFGYASGTWYKNYELPADKTRFGAFNALRDRSEEQVKAIVDDLMTKQDLNTEEKMVHDFYSAYKIGRAHV